MDLLVATRSADKLVEIRRILRTVPDLRVLGPDEAGIPFDPAEDDLEPHPTFEENASSKAAYFRIKSGLTTVADDSGLEVDALGGAPGVRSKRFAPSRDLGGQERDEANNAHLLKLLANVDPSRRTARYVCVAVLAEDGSRTTTLRGEASGILLSGPRGDGGFGYDPLFFDPEIGLTFAQISRDQKNLRSHRGAAFRALAAHLTSTIRAP